jgi:uroporphyrin-III C-methyltransferase / precorrin-2 dehydrogenase / sirohydrochlorin ferrochelatase
MKQLPIFLDVQSRRCLMVGGGLVAARKVDTLLHYGAQVTVVAPELCSGVAALRDSGRLVHQQRRFEPTDLDGCHLVYAATSDEAVNAQVSALAQARRIPVNVVDNPALCSFIMPSIIDRDPVQVAVSTGGASPVLARLLRTRLETLIPASYGQLARLMARFRAAARSRFTDGTQRRRFWEDVLNGPIAEMLFAGQDAAAERALEQALGEDHPQPPTTGEVYLVGGGPGDPDLLTFRALRLMQQADVVIHDRLVAEPILALTRKDAERIYVGKERDQHTVPQGEINALLVRLARQGHRVLRLKGGDPFIFGRGGEEIETLSAEGIPFQVVPGITAAAGCASYAGIPLTHRDYAQSCVFVTGHLKDGSMDLNWDAVVQPRQTIAIYMGVHGIAQLCAGLIAHGMSPEMPAALIERGTMPQQRVLVGTLANLPEIVKAGSVQPPSLLIVGEVVQLHQRLAWFEPR